MTTLHQIKQELNIQLDNGERTPIFTDTSHTTHYTRHIQIIAWDDTHLFYNSIIGDQMGGPANVQSEKFKTNKAGDKYVGLFYGGFKNIMNRLDTYIEYDYGYDGVAYFNEPSPEDVAEAIEMEQVEAELEEEAELVEDKSEETLRILDMYVPKKLHDGIKDITKTYDGYDVQLEHGWLFDENNTMFISPTIADLRQDMKRVEKYDKHEWVELMQGMGYTDVKEWGVELEDKLLEAYGRELAKLKWTKRYISEHIKHFGPDMLESEHEQNMDELEEIKDKIDFLEYQIGRMVG